MCGIAGQFGACSEITVRDLIQAIAHRGPDQSWELVRSQSYIGAACRLSITERQSGNQPWKNALGTIYVSFNGEIYNYRKIQEELLAVKVALRNSSECEMLIAAYETYGVDAFAKLEGMFAIALYDDIRKCLYLVRDRFGIKPLYFLELPETIVYSSEIKSFFASRLAAADIDECYAAHRYVFGFGPAEHTLFSGVAAVVPGTYLEVSATNVSAHRFVSMENRSVVLASRAELCYGIKNLVASSVTARLPREVEWGVFLSGGLDSSVLAVCAEDGRNGLMRLFTLVDRFETPDVVAARIVARDLDCPLAECQTGSGSKTLLLEYLLAREEFDILNLFWFVLSAEVAKHVSVALCGQGADELFCGYPFYRNVDGTLEQFNQRWRSIQSRVSSASADFVRDRLELLMTGDRMHNFYEWFLRDQLVWFQLEPLDKCSMAHGLEVRLPYLDEELVSVVSSLPIDLLYEGEKQILRDAFRQSKVSSIDRPKRFSGRWTIPTMHQEMVEICTNIVGEQVPESYRYAWMVEDSVDAVCLEALLILMTQCGARKPDANNIEDIFQIIKKKIRSV